MASKKPIVLNGGQAEQIQSSDILLAAALGTGVADGTTYLRGDGTWATPIAALPDMVVTKLSATSNTTIAAGYGAYVPGQYEIANGIYLEISNGSIFEIG